MEYIPNIWYNYGVYSEDRLLKMDLPQGQSAFLFGARKTGKSTYLKKHYPSSVYIDLLQTDLYLAYSKAPWILREEITKLDAEALIHPIVIDEIQKIPELLDEIHWLIENTDAYFILCGSSARKLRQRGVNLLGGRAISYYFFPFVYPEITNFDLLKALNFGLLPSHYLANDPEALLRSYVQEYLTQEIQQEALTRNLPSFMRFLDSFAYHNGELVNYSNIARDCGIDSKTVKEYFQILVDTLIGYYVHPYVPKSGRDVLSATSKFYLFDTGIVTQLTQEYLKQIKGDFAGKLFENFILSQLIAYKYLVSPNIEIKFWRTRTELEVDFIITRGKKVLASIESKISNNIGKTDINGLIAFQEENKSVPAYVVSFVTKARRIQGNDNADIDVYPYIEFLEKLWKGELF